jgi:AmmeMemoRadiSam system protein B
LICAPDRIIIIYGFAASSEVDMKHPAALALVFALALAAWGASAQDVRKAVRAGQFYEADPAALGAGIDACLAAAPAPSAAAGRIRALVVPHAGYAYSAKTAARAYRQVQGRDIPTVVVLGPSHFVGFEGCSIFSGDGFETPLGVAAVDAAPARAVIKATGFY